MFKNSLGVRHVNCGSCNGCEHEINALTSALYDITRDGWDIFASPRHADVITVTGPMTEAMQQASRDTIEAAPRSCVVLGIGDCAAGKGPWVGAPAVGAGSAVGLAGEIVVRGSRRRRRTFGPVRGRQPRFWIGRGSRIYAHEKVHAIFEMMLAVRRCGTSVS